VGGGGGSLYTELHRWDWTIGGLGRGGSVGDRGGGRGVSIQSIMGRVESDC
jgi:hypothetical protein